MIPLAAVLALAPAGFRFSGGGDLDLLRALAPKVVSGPLVAVSYRERISGFSFTTDDRFWSRVEREANRQTDRETGLAMYRTNYPETAFNSRRNAEAPPEFDGAAFLRNRRVVGEPSGPFQVGSLPKARWSKPLRIHYLYRQIPVVAVGRNASEEDFLKALSEAVGAKFVEGDAYEVRLDPKEFRTRMLPTIDNVRRRSASRDPLRDTNLGRLGVTREALASMTDGEIGRAFATPTSNERVGKPSANLRRSLNQYFATINAAVAYPGASKGDKARAALLQRIDLSKPIVIDLYGDFQVFIGIPILGGGTGSI